MAIVDIQSTPNEQLNRLFAEYPLTKISYFQIDITDEADLRKTFNRINEKFKSIDILINAAGIFNDTNIEKTFKVNVVNKIWDIFYYIVLIAIECMNA